MTLGQLTHEQQEFAAENHDLVFSFLNANHLDDNDYYDIVVFGFLAAVKNYLSQARLRKYKFSTIAFRNMKSSLSNFQKEQEQQKRKAVTVSLEYRVAGDDSSLLFRDVTPGIDSLLGDFTTEMLLHEIAARVNKKQFRVIRLKAEGYGVREIARKQRLTIRTVDDILKDVKQAVHSACRA